MITGLTLDNLSKRYGADVFALEEVSLEAAQGELIVIVGPSGCGKSTLLRLIAGLEKPTSGTILINGRPVNDIEPKDRDVAMVFQNYALYPHMTVYQNMAFGLKMRNIPKEHIRRRVLRAAETLQLTALLKRKSSLLSGGQQQRVALGRAMVRDPQLFLFDEPLSNLDAKLRTTMRTELIRLHKQLKTTMIYVTHDQTEAMSMGNRVVVLHEGKTQQIGPPHEVYRNPANLFVAGFIGSPPMNFIPCSLAEQNELTLKETGEQLAIPEEIHTRCQTAATSTDVLLGIRPEDFVKSELDSEKKPAHHVLLLHVEFLQQLGSEVLANCYLGTLEILVRLSPQTKINEEKNVPFVFDMTKAKLFDQQTGEVLW